MKISFFKKVGDNTIPVNKDNWELAWAPAKKSHWQDGKSSKELSKFAASESFIPFISKVLKDCNIKEQDFECEPESRNSLGPGFNPGVRHHDLLMIGEDCIIGIEAKVCETFDGKINDIIDEQKVKYHNDETKTRAYKLKEDLTPDSNAGQIGYQLYTATRATVYSAIQHNKDICIMLVIVFTGNVRLDKPENVKKNNKDFTDFKQMVGKYQKGDNEYFNLWNKKCRIEKYEVNISNCYNF